MNKEFSRLLSKEEAIKEREGKAITPEEIDIWAKNLLEKIEDIMKDLERPEEKIEKTPKAFPYEDTLKENKIIADEFYKSILDFDLGLPTKTIPKEIQIPEEKKVGEFESIFDFNIEDFITK